jgi:anti-anti-sigma factor
MDALIKHIDNDTLLITFIGEMDMFTAASLTFLYEKPYNGSSIVTLLRYNEFINVITENYNIIKLDLKQVSYLDSTGLAFIVSLVKKFRNIRKKIGVTEFSDNALSLFKLIDAIDFVEFHDLDIK